MCFVIRYKTRGVVELKVCIDKKLRYATLTTLFILCSEKSLLGASRQRRVSEPLTSRATVSICALENERLVPVVRTW